MLLESIFDLVKLAVDAAVANEWEESRRRCAQARKELRKAEFECLSESCAYHTTQLYRLKKLRDTLKARVSNLPADQASLFASLFSDLDHRIEETRQRRN